MFDVCSKTAERAKMNLESGKQVDDFDDDCMALFVENQRTDVLVLQVIGVRY